MSGEAPSPGRPHTVTWYAGGAINPLLPGLLCGAQLSPFSGIVQYPNTTCALYLAVCLTRKASSGNLSAAQSPTPQQQEQLLQQFQQFQLFQQFHQFYRSAKGTEEKLDLYLYIIYAMETVSLETCGIYNHVRCENCGKRYQNYKK